MKTIRVIFRDGTLEPLDPVDLPENTRLTLAMLDPDDLAAEAITQLAGNVPATAALVAVEAVSAVLA